MKKHFFFRRHLPPEPAPPRAVIIERLPPLPPKPRDIIIERWLPYEIVNQKRKVMVEHVQKNSRDHPQPKNVIITYVQFFFPQQFFIISFFIVINLFKQKLNVIFKNKMLFEKIHRHIQIVLVINYVNQLLLYSKLVQLEFLKI